MKKFALLSITLALSVFAHGQTGTVPVYGPLRSSGSGFPTIYSPAIVFPTDADYTPAFPLTSGSGGVMPVTSTTALTAQHNLILPLVQGLQFALINNTTGGQTIVPKGASGAAAAPIANCSVTPSSCAAIVVSDGVNYRQVGAASSAGGITALTGDISASGTGSVSAILASVGTAQTVGDGGHIPVVTQDAKGRVLTMTTAVVNDPTACKTGNLSACPSAGQLPIDNTKPSEIFFTPNGNAPTVPTSGAAIGITATVTTPSLSILPDAPYNGLSAKANSAGAMREVPATTGMISTLLGTSTGCSTAGYVYSPQSNTCVAAGGSGGGSSTGAAGVAQASNGSGGFAVTNITTPGPSRVNGFGDSIWAGDYDSPSTLNTFNVWASAYEPQATLNNQAVSGYSLQDIAPLVYGTTFGVGDLSAHESATNDNVGTISSPGYQYIHALMDEVAYSAIPDGIGSSGYAGKIKGTALTLSGTGWSTSTQYAIASITTHATDTAAWPGGFVGNVFYLSLITQGSSSQTVSVAIDGGAATSYTVGSGAPIPYEYDYNSHSHGYTYGPSLIRQPLLGGRGVHHSVVVTCTTAPCSISWMGSNAAKPGPQAVAVGLQQNQTDADGSAATAQNLWSRWIAGALTADGLNVAHASMDGCLNYYAGPNFAVTGSTTSGSNSVTLTTGTTAGFVVNMGVNGGSFATSSTVYGITDSTHFQMNNNATATATGVSFTGNYNWANAIHPDNLGSASAAQCLGRATSPVVTGREKTGGDILPRSPLAVSFMYPAWDGLTNTGYVQTLSIPVPMKLSSVNIGQLGTLFSCSTTTAQPYLQVFAGNYSINIPFSSLGANYSTQINYPFDLFNQTLVFKLNSAQGGGCAAGNAMLNITATFEPL